MRSSISLAVLVVAGISVFTTGPASPLPTPPVLIDSGLDFIRSDKDQEYPAAAFDGTNWLVVWQDKRGDRTAVWATRVNSGGVPLDSANFCIADDAKERVEPRVAFNGTHYLVVWQDGRNSTYDIYGARVTPAGTVLEPNGFPISRSAGSQKFPAVASAGSDFLVVWQDTRNSGNDEDIYAARVTGSGQVLDTGGIAVSTAFMPQEYPTVTSYGAGYLVTWKDRRNDSLTSDDIYAARVSTAGTVLDPSGIAVSRAAGSQDVPTVASDGTNCLIVWEDYRSTVSGDAYGARVSNAGVVLDPSGLPIHTSPNSWQGEPSVAFNGSNYMVVWADDSATSGMENDVMAARVTTLGAVLDTAGIVVTSVHGDQSWPIVAPGGTNLLAAWHDYRNGSDPDIYANRLSPSGAPLDTADMMLSRVMYAYEQTTPAIAFDGTNFLTVWNDDRAPQMGGSLFGARVSQAGALLDPGGFRVARSFSTSGAPAVAFGSGNYLVSWYYAGGGAYGVSAARLTPAGTLLDSNGIYTGIYGSDGGPSAVAFDGTNWLVVSAFKDYGGLANVQGARITQEGVLLDTHPTRMAYAPRDLEAAAVAFGATSYLVVWEDFRSGSTYDIYGARISPDGTDLDSGGIAISTGAGSTYGPSVAFDGTNWLVAWQDTRAGGDEGYYYCTRVSQSGTVLDPGGIPLGWKPENYQDPLQLAFDGTNCFAVWQYHSYSEGDLKGARISPSGAIVDTFPVCTAYEYQATPAVALGTGGRIMVSYAGYVPALHGYPTDVMRIWTGIYPFNGISEVPVSPPRIRTGATIVRGVLELPRAAGLKPQASSCLLDIAGRKVLNLHPGPNDVSRLAPGVYFVRLSSAHLVKARKVILMK